MESKAPWFLSIWGGALLLSLAGCGADDNSPEMGKVAPKPNMDMNSKLPQSVRDKMTQAKPGSDAAAMGASKHLPGKP